MPEDSVRILLVEDDEEDALITRKLLAEIPDQTFSLAWVTTYEEGLKEILRGEHDVCLLDFKLGARDGTELLRAARTRGTTTPIIFFTGNGTRVVDVEAMRAGAADFLVKGSTDARLLERSIRYALTHHRTNEALRLFNAAVEQASESVVITTAELEGRGPTIVYVNPAFTEMTGYEAAEVLGQSPRILEGPKTDRPMLVELREHLARGERFYGETVTYRKDSSEFWVAFHVGPIRDRLGNVTHYVSLQQDISERRDAEDERARMEEQLRQAQKMEAIGRLAGGVAHDFNNTLTVILAYSDLLLAGLSEPDPRRPHALEIEKAGRRAQRLTRQLLSFSRGQLLEPTTVDLNELVDGMAGLLRPLIGDDIVVETSLATALAPVEVDPIQIEQAILNLAANARDAMPAGGHLTIQTANAEEDAYVRLGLEPGSYVLLAVHDTGTGMDEETRARVFEPFFTTKEVGKGTGLGLSSILGIVEQSGGRVVVSSELGNGTTVEIYLPRAEAAVERAGDVQREAVKPELGSETVLVVDDDDGVRLLATLALGERGYTVLSARSGPEAIRLAHAHDGPIDLLVSDVTMPAMRGDELAEQLTSERPELDVLYVSGYAGDELGERGFPDPGTRLLPKPFVAHELLREVRRILDESPRRRSRGLSASPAS